MNRSLHRIPSVGSQPVIHFWTGTAEARKSQDQGSREQRSQNRLNCDSGGPIAHGMIGPSLSRAKRTTKVQNNPQYDGSSILSSVTEMTSGYRKGNQDRRQRSPFTVPPRLESGNPSLPPYSANSESWSIGPLSEAEFPSNPRLGAKQAGPSVFGLVWNTLVRQTPRDKAKFSLH